MPCAAPGSDRPVPAARTPVPAATVREAVMEVVALVGPSGTGKSHRAAAVAREVEADALIDDGLLIRESRIVAGVSAKREATKIGAIRRALFVDPAHRDGVRRALEALRPRRVLILGTSRDMVDRIAAALGLPAPARYIGIEEVATPAEIRRAQLIRRTQGRHVIPAPTFEVKRSFSGYLLDPLRLFYRGKNRPAGPGQVIEKTMVRPTYSSLGRFFITRQVVGSIAAYAAARVTGVPRCCGPASRTGRRGWPSPWRWPWNRGAPCGPCWPRPSARRCRRWST